MSLNLVLNYEASALAAPQSFRDGMQAAANILDSLIQDNITVTIQVGYGDWYNNADTGLTTGAEGGDLSGSYVSYSTLCAALATHTTSAIDLALVNSLPATSSVNGVSSYWVSSAVEKALGLISPTANTLDGAVGMGTQISGSLLVGVALHELTHAMGRVPDNFSFDLVRYTSVGSHLFSTAATAPAAYFSVDGGYTKLADFGQTSDPSDFLNSGVQGSTDPFNEFYSWSTNQSLATVDKQIMDAIGFNVTPPTPVQIEASGLTILNQVGLNYSLVTGSAIITLKYGGADVVADEFGAWVPIGAEQVGTGYDVAWKDPVLNRYTVWSTDSNGNYLASIIYPGSGSSLALESIETVFHQDLNGDGTIGVPTIVIHTNGLTSLTQVGENYYLYNAGVGPELKYGGAPVTVGEFAGGWTPIGAVQTASGYDVAWQVPGADRYTVWSTDSNSNYLASIIYPGSGSSLALESIETVFNQDLNGDGTIGAPTIVIHTNGLTSLTQVGENYYLYNAGVGPELKYGGAPVTVGEFAGGWTPIGAVQTATGYDVAWQVPGADRYTVWSTDSNGNYLASIVYPGSGSSIALESLEPTFHQDLNGDGIIGVPPAATAFLTSPSSAASSFDGSTVTLSFGTASTVNATLVGFSGDGTLSGSNQVDLRDLNLAKLQSSFDASSGVLSVSDGTHTANLQFLGAQSQESFKFADDGAGGTAIYVAPPAGASSSAPASAVATLAGEAFVYGPNFGQATLAHFDPAADSLQINHSVFANVNAFFAAAHDDGSGNVVVTDTFHDALSIQHVTLAQLQAHQNDFHIV